jgi:hypothetical protein
MKTFQQNVKTLNMSTASHANGVPEFLFRNAGGRSEEIEEN